MKKMPMLGMLGVLLAASFVMPVSAHGHHHNQTDTAAYAVCEVCTVEGCDETGLHTHNDETYCGYGHKSGYCDGSCGAVEVCTVKGCDETGHHTHNKTTYCGYAHDCGYCDGSCVQTADSNNVGHCGRRRHHGR